MNSLIERKLEVFVGSTKEDLKDARKAVIWAILEAGHIPSCMELWPAGNSTTQASILYRLNSCDVHIILIGANYGSDSQIDDFSFTQWEFNISTGANRPVLAFLLDEPEYCQIKEKKINEISDELEKNRIISSIEKLDKFRKILKDKSICIFFSNIEEGRMVLARQCTNAIYDIRNKLPENGGWMRANEKDADTVRQIGKNPFLKGVIDRLHQFSKLTQRIVEDREAKEALANVFWEEMTGLIKDNNYRHIFFESGSTVAYVSDHFHSDVIPHIDKLERWQITTNNILTLLHLMLHSNIRVTPVPAAAPDPKDKYGAIFLPRQHSARHAFPRKPRKLFDSEIKLVEELRKLLEKDSPPANTKIKGKQNQLILATTSGLDLENIEIDFQGPHVGSHANMIFKRALFTTGAPIILFINDKKLGMPFVPGKCFPVFGIDFRWKDVLTNTPLAICVGYSVSSTNHKEYFKKEQILLSRITKMLKELGLDETYADGTTETGGAVIAANEAFKKIFPRDI